MFPDAIVLNWDEKDGIFVQTVSAFPQTPVHRVHFARAPIVGVPCMDRPG